MINRLQRMTMVWTFAAGATVVLCGPSFAQKPTDAQKSAIRSACRSDYMAHCASVPPGGAASVQCLAKNMASLSSACQAAVRAIEPTAKTETPKTETPKTETKAEPPPVTETKPPASEASRPASESTKPVEEAAKPATGTAKEESKPAAEASKSAAPASAAKQPTQAQISAIRSACRSDYPSVCAGVPTGGAAALQCLAKNQAKLSPSCGKAVAAVSAGATAPAAAATGAASTPAADANPSPAATAPPVLVLRPLRPLEEMRVARSACGADVRTLCAGVPAGGGRIARCLAANAAALSPACRDVLSEFAAR
jgi:hypothetical protein